MIKIIFSLLITSLGAVQIAIQDVHLEVELAITRDAQKKGLSGRKELPEGTGMLFVYPYPQKTCFWMKDTLVPLSIAFFDESKKLIAWKDMPPPGEEKLTMVCSPKLALYALEVPLGWFLNHKILPDAQFSYVPQSDNKL